MSVDMGEQPNKLSERHQVVEASSRQFMAGAAFTKLGKKG